jgi:hypothetical protein
LQVSEWLPGDCATKRRLPPSTGVQPIIAYPSPLNSRRNTDYKTLG